MAGGCGGEGVRRVWVAGESRSWVWVVPVGGDGGVPLSVVSEEFSFGWYYLCV